MTKRLHIPLGIGYIHIIHSANSVGGGWLKIHSLSIRITSAHNYLCIGLGSYYSQIRREMEACFASL